MGAEWTTRPLGELAERLTTKNAEGNSNVLTISAQRGLVNQRLYFNKHVASDNLSHYYLLERGDFAYNKSYSDGYPVGAIKRLDKYEKGVVSPLYICFRVTSHGPVASDYLVHFFESGLLEREIRAIAKEGARNHGLLNVKPSEFFALPVVLPPLSEQRKIAAILSSVDHAIETTNTVIDHLQVVKKAMMAELLTRGLPGRHTHLKQTEIGQMPEDWDMVTMGQICERIVVGIVVRPASYYVTQGIPALRSKNVRAGYLELDDVVHISPESNAVLSKSKIKTGDVLTVRTGAPGVSCVVPSELDGANCIDLIVSTPSPSRITGAFLALLMNSTVGAASVALRKGGLAQQHFNVGAMKETPIPVPSLNEQIEITSALDAIDDRLARESECRGELVALKSALMFLLLTGEHRVPLDKAAA